MRIVYHGDRGYGHTAEIFNKYGELVHTITGGRFVDVCGEAYSWVRQQEMTYA